MRLNSLFVAAVGGCLAFASYAGVAAAQNEATNETNDTAIIGTAQANTHGRGESLVLVVGGVYATQADADAAVAASNQGEFSGYYLASTADFRVTAGYADVRPARGAIACNASEMAVASRTLPELAQITPKQLEIACLKLKEATGGDSLSLSLDTRLERVPFGQGARGAVRLAAPSSCDPSSRCMGAAVSALSPSGTLPADQWMAVSAFRTRAGAEQFVTFQRDAGSGPPSMVLQVVRQAGTTNIGLGQESHPDGSGPAVMPLPQQEVFQR